MDSHRFVSPAHDTANRQWRRVVWRRLTVIATVLALVCALSPSLHASDETPRRFELHVVGPDGQPVPEAKVELRTRPAPTAEQIEQGKFVKKGPYGANVTADADGRLVVRLPAALKNIEVFVEMPGFGPYVARWSPEDNSASVPEQFTAELEAGWSIGGIVVDSEGRPVAGVKVRPSIEFKKGGAVKSQLGVGTNLKTDAAGKWHFDSVPDSMQEVHFEIGHADFKPTRLSLTRSENEIKRGLEPEKKLVLDRGLTVTGKVTDETGNPIPGALLRTKFLNDLREAKTGDDGVYRLGGCEPLLARIVVSAKGRATDLQEVHIEPDMQPVDFQMKPGGKIRIRVVDEQDNGIPKARIFFQQWRLPNYQYFELDNINQYADKNGVWEWNEAPLDMIEADICRPDGMQLSRQPLIAREEEYVFHPPPALVISGSVVDAETKQPIKKFQVVPAIRSSPTHMNLVRGQEFTATDGKFQLKEDYDYFAYFVQIEADGYLPAKSRDIKSNEGKTTVEIELSKGKNIDAAVLQPDGSPASGAKIVLGVAGSQINVVNGEIAGQSTLAAETAADRSGRFHFPPQGGPFQLVITHPSGFAHVVGSAAAPPEKVQLLPWAKVEGVFRVGQKAMAGAPITFNTVELSSYGDGVPHIFCTYDVTTGKDGKFAFEHMIPGKGRIGRRIMLTVNDGATDVTSSCMVPVDFPAGETTQIELGGTGRAVIGKLQPPEGFEGKVQWNLALVTADWYEPELPPLVDPPIPADVAANTAQKAAWMLEWEQTDAGKAWSVLKGLHEDNQRLRDTSPYLNASADRDGSFRIDDVPAGEYTLMVRFPRNVPGRIVHYRFTIPTMDGNRSDEPLNLGTLTLEKN